jgi:hypothetical protein
MGYFVVLLGARVYDVLDQLGCGLLVEAEGEFFWGRLTVQLVAGQLCDYG